MGERWSSVLQGIDRAVAQARAAVDRLEGRLSSCPTARFAVRLLVSELFTNAVKYGGQRGDAPVRLALELGESHVRAEVGDHGRRFFRGPSVDAGGGCRRRNVGFAFLDAG